MERPDGNSQYLMDLSNHKIRCSPSVWASITWLGSDRKTHLGVDILSRSYQDFFMRSNSPCRNKYLHLFPCLFIISVSPQSLLFIIFSSYAWSKYSYANIIKILKYFIDSAQLPHPKPIEQSQPTQIYL